MKLLNILLTIYIHINYMTAFLNKMIKYSITILSNISILLLISLFIYIFYTKDYREFVIVSTILIFGYIFHRYELGHAVPIIVFFTTNILQEWYAIIINAIL
jgi:hypothetical protein